MMCLTNKSITFPFTEVYSTAILAQCWKIILPSYVFGIKTQIHELLTLCSPLFLPQTQRQAIVINRNAQ